MAKIRSLICAVIGHIDHGKSSILDQIRGTAIVKEEAGGITQSISSTNLSINVIENICGKLLDTLKQKITLPGILFLDTPGHAAFNNLRKRGGNLADIAILVIDINEGVMPQTEECINILKQYKTPFIIAANKIDLISGWEKSNKFLLQAINEQSENVKQVIETKLYEIVGKMHKLGFSSERFDRVEDYSKQVAIVPVSAKTGEGVPEMLMVLTGLAQRFLERKLEFDVEGPAKGTVLEVKESKGLGTTLDVIIHDGKIKIKDEVVIGGINNPVVTSVKALFVPEGKKFKNVKEVKAALGVKVSANNIKDVVAGMPLRGVKNNLEKIKKEVQEEVEEVLIETDKEGIVIKADSLGSLEALIGLLKQKGYSIKRASIGDITKRDVAACSAEEQAVNCAILGFNVKSLEKKEDIKIITNKVIYNLIEEFERWQEDVRKKEEAKALKDLIRPAKVMVMPGYVFRQSNPAIAGLDVLGGLLKVSSPLMKSNGDKAGYIKGIQEDGENIQEAIKGKQVAVSIPEITIGRQVQEGDTLYSDVPEKDFIKLKELKRYLSKDEVDVMKEIVLIKRKQNPVWGV